MEKTNTKIVHIAISLAILVVAASAAAAEKEAASVVVNINTATESELSHLPGIGPATAANIIKYREKQPFQKARHLMRVKGIGRKTFAKIEQYVVVQGPTTATAKIRPQKE